LTFSRGSSVIEIHARTGKEKVLTEILETYRREYPVRYRFFREALRKMWEVSKNPDGSFVDQKGREARISMRVPTELMLFIQRHIEDFGRDYEDIKLLKRVAEEFFPRTHLRRSRFYTLRSLGHGFERSDDRPERRDEAPEVCGEPTA